MRAFFLMLAATALLAPVPAQAENGWTLAWSDEFDQGKIDRAKWAFETDCWGGGNNERQCYTKSGQNAAVKDGKLVITARHERTTGPALPAHLRTGAGTSEAEATRDFSSAKLTTHGKASWRFGKLEVRAKLPLGQGTWPAIWMLPEKNAYGPWAASGEIDVLEAVNLGVPCGKCKGEREDTILGTLHFGGKWPKNLHRGEEVPFPEVLDGGFHTYGIEWEPGKITWQFDGKTYATRTASEWSTTGSSAPGAPFDQPFYLILNLAIGGGLPEERGLGGVRLDGYPKLMEVDWVRVWQPDAGTAGKRSEGGK